MKFILKHFKSDFSKNVLTLITGTTVSQAIPVAITPILTRLYSPDDFGVFALFLAIVAITGAIANAQYEQAIILPKEDKQSFNLIALGVFFSTTISLLLLIIVLFFNEELALFFGNKTIAPYLYLIPISTFLLGIYNSFNYFNIKKSEFKNIAKSQIIRSSSLGFSQILIGILSYGPIGLVLGQIISYLSGNTILFKTIKKNYEKGFINKNQIRSLAVAYNKFPKYSLPSVFLNSINLNILNIFISILFNVTTLGFFSLTQRIIGVPSRIIGSSISQVYLKQSSDDINNNKSTKKVFLKTLKKLTTLCIPIFLVLFFIVEPAFAFVFGEEWRVSGYYAKILIPLAAVRFLSSTLTGTFIVHQKQQILLYFNIVLLISIIFIFVISKINNFKIEQFLLFYTLIVSIIYLTLLVINWNVSKRNVV